LSKEISKYWLDYVNNNIVKKNSSANVEANIPVLVYTLLSPLLKQLCER
jgi:hypothetical protein